MLSSKWVVAFGWGWGGKVVIDWTRLKSEGALMQIGLGLGPMVDFRLNEKLARMEDLLDMALSRRSRGRGGGGDNGSGDGCFPVSLSLSYEAKRIGETSPG